MTSFSYYEPVITCGTPRMSILNHQGVTTVDSEQFYWRVVESPKPNLRVLFGLCDSPKYVAEVHTPLSNSRCMDSS